MTTMRVLTTLDLMAKYEGVQTSGTGENTRSNERMLGVSVLYDVKVRASINDAK